MKRNFSSEEQKQLSLRSDLIEEFTKAGMEMLTEMMNSKEILKTDLASIMMFRQIIEVGDALSILVFNGCVNAAKPLLRSMLENYFQLAYLFQDNEERKALQFLYHYEMKNREYFEKLAYPEKGGSFFEKLKSDKHLKGDIISEYQTETYIENIAKIDIVLNGENNKDIAKEYERTIERKTNQRNGKKGKVLHWYELFDGPKNIEGISIRLNEAALYQFIYRSCSSYTHGEDIIHANLEPDSYETYKISELRDLRQLYIVTDNILLLLELSFVLFLKKKISEQKNFAEKILPLMRLRREHSLKK